MPVSYVTITYLFLVYLKNVSIYYHKLSTKLTMYRKGVYYSSIKIWNKLLDIVAELVSKEKCF